MADLTPTSMSMNTMDDARAVQIIRSKRDGLELSADDYRFLTTHIADRQLTDAQLGAWLMAAYCQPLSMHESAVLTRAMAASGWQCDWRGFDLPGPVLDKHSTGGLGDIISFLLAPMVAACGGFVPMISGRSLEHTGGTIDKLESIPGYNPFPSPERFQQVVADHGLAIVGQTAQMVPADQRLYAIRGQTATVDSLPLIAASILSKKVTEDLDGLVIDLKVGSGAFMQNQAEGQPLMDMLDGVASACELNCRIMFTDMHQPLANCVGDSVEVREAVRYLTGERRTGRLHQTALALSAELLLLGGIADNADSAREKLQAALDSGKAAECFQTMVAALGGPADFVDMPDHHLQQAAVIRPVEASHSGSVNSIDGRSLGHAVHHTAAVQDSRSFDHRVGIAELCELQQRFDSGQPLAVVHARNEIEYQYLAGVIKQAIKIT